MDLGFGSSNQQIGSTAASSILAITSAQEEAMAAQISKYDALLDAKDSELEVLREQRLKQMKLKHEQVLQWKANGHGVYMELLDNPPPSAAAAAAAAGTTTTTTISEDGGGGGGDDDVARAFFNTAKTSPRMIVHFYRNTTRSCDYFHRALSILAPKHLETKFIKINVEGCTDVRESGRSVVGIKYLVEKLGIVIMPTVLIVVNRKAVHHVRGFDELGGTEEFSVHELANLLGRHGGLTLTEEEERMTSSSMPGGSADEKRSSSSATSRQGSLRSMYFYGSDVNRGPRSGGYDDYEDDDE